jgi:hypothetical protein
MFNKNNDMEEFAPAAEVTPSKFIDGDVYIPVSAIDALAAKLRESILLQQMVGVINESEAVRMASVAAYFLYYRDAIIAKHAGDFVEEAVQAHE